MLKVLGKSVGGENAKSAEIMRRVFEVVKNMSEGITKA